MGASVHSDARHERMDRVAVLYAEITAATRDFFRAVVACDEHRDWEAEGFGSCAEWLAWRLGVTRDTAGEKVRAARALERLPLISEAMARGELSYTKVRALTRAATKDNEADLLTYARACSAAGLERLVRGWKTLGRLGEARAERLRHGMRSFSVFPSNEGMYVVKGLVTPEVGALLMRAIEAASDALFSETADDDGERPEPRQSRADALGLLAERALAAGFGGARGERDNDDDEPVEASAACGRRAPRGAAPISGTRAARYQVLLHVEPETLQERDGRAGSGGGGPGMSELEDGTRLSAESARRLACDAGLVTIVPGTQVPGATDSVLDVGRKTRTVPPSVRRALEARDRGCRFPGCGLRFTDAHHVVHWADGGETNLANLILLCARHHRAVHEGRFRVCVGRDGRSVFFGPSGRVLASAPPLPSLPAEAAAAPAERLRRRNRERGIEPPDWRTGWPPYRHDRHVPWSIEAAALEAIDDVLGGDELPDRTLAPPLENVA